ncbi:hypothetical protein [Petroclostridium sp. X23]|uniref:hypothetical protein n=1 Tax=Petroclostridium sp. X23 TaxID=3045146 RepID=UPI0024AE5F67|nr:hypothetical protein [Petroclostridium sp. X23]WHH60397.1 hypothetical protein QKW49_06645 [Petroclostridium sp. X23]
MGETSIPESLRQPSSFEEKRIKRQMPIATDANISSIEEILESKGFSGSEIDECSCTDIILFSESMIDKDASDKLKKETGCFYNFIITQNIEYTINIADEIPEANTKPLSSDNITLPDILIKDDSLKQILIGIIINYISNRFKKRDKIKKDKLIVSFKIYSRKGRRIKKVIQYEGGLEGLEELLKKKI